MREHPATGPSFSRQLLSTFSRDHHGPTTGFSVHEEPNVGGSEMASREKKPLAPSKSKQRASSDSSLSSNEVKNKKGKSLPNIKQQQVAQEIFDTVVTGSQLPVKLEASLPRRNALKTLKRRQNLRAAKANFIKSKVDRKVTNKGIHRISPDIKRGVKTKRIKQSEESTLKADIALRFSENQANNGDNEGKGTETPSKSAKNNLRTKKTKSASSRSIEVGSEGIQNKEEAGATSSAKSSPKFGRKGRTTDSSDSLSKSAKAARLTNLKKNSTKDNFVKVAESDSKGTKGRKNASKELDCSGSTKGNSSIERFAKAALDNKSSIDLTIDEVIASMLSDSEENQSAADKIEGKITRSKKMLVDENIACDAEIKKEPDIDDTKVASDGECAEADQGFQNAIQLRKRSKAGYIDQTSQRSLRNGKQRQLSDSGNSTDNDPKKRHRLNSDGTFISDNLIEHISDVNMDFSDSNCNESPTIVATSKGEICLAKDEASKNFNDDAATGLEVENNNNSDRVDRTSETGPTLRSKTKAKTTESEAAKDEDGKTEDTRITSKCADTQEESKKLYNVDQVRKESILVKYADKSKGRRNSLNIENTKKTANSIYNTDKSDDNSQQIDQMIKDIKLNIAKSIESKIYSPETGIGLSKNFDVPKIEEIVAPLSTESQKMGLEENADENRTLVTKNEITSENSENSVPKVADTAKEIEEKLVMFDIGEAETHSQNIQEDKASNSDRINDVHNTCESTCNIANNNNDASCNNADGPEMENVNRSTASDTPVNISDNDSKSLEENTKKVATTRKSSRIHDKNSDSAGSNPEAKKSNKSPSKVVSKSDNVAGNLTDNATSEEVVSEDVTSRQLSDDNATVSSVLASASSDEAEENLAEEQMEETQNCETECSQNVSCISEDSETLESISRDVERLVAGDQSIKSSQDAEEISDANMLEKQQEIENTSEQASACCDDNSTSLESAVSDTNEMPSKSHTDEKADATETLQEDDTSCKVTQSTNHLKTNNNNNDLSTTANCDSISECSSVNSVPVPACTSDRWTDKAEELDQVSKDLSKSNDMPDSDENASDQKSEHNETALTTDQSNKSDDKDEQKPVNEEKRRVLRTRDKQKRIESKQVASREHTDGVNVKTEETDVQKTANSTPQNDANEAQSSSVDDSENSQKVEDTGDSQNSHDLDTNDLEPQARTRRTRDTKKRKEESSMSNVSKAKRLKRDLRKSDQQNKEETLLDNEVAKINENNRSLLNKFVTEFEDSFREFFEESGQSGLNKMQKSPNLRSKSENDITIGTTSKSEERLSRNLSENHVSEQTADNIDILKNDCKTLKTLEQKDSDDSTSSESSNSRTQILETPEEKERKESLMRMLGLVTLEQAAKPQNQQKSKKESVLVQSSTGTLKTIIRVSQKEKDKRGSRSPLKMVLKQQQGRGDGEGDSLEFYTIQKEFGTSGLGDSSSGANRKFTTNHRHSCDDDNEDTAPKDRQSLVIPEKSSSFSIHPGRVCADVCSYCFGKFGSLDTPMHLAQIKSDERRKKILSIEMHLTKDSCLCDACYRHVDRKANTSPTNMQQKPQKQHRQLMISKCSARGCRDAGRHNVKRRWLLNTKIKPALLNLVDIDWDTSQNNTSMSFCVSHYEKIGRFLICALCKRRLARNSTRQLTSVEVDQLNQLLGQQGIPVLLAAGTFVCKLCRYFIQLHLKYKDIENMSTDRRTYCKDYRRRILRNIGVEIVDEEDDDSAQQANQAKLDKKTKRGTKNVQQSKSGSSKSPDCTSEKSTPENRSEAVAGCSSSEVGNDSRIAKGSNASGDENGGAEYLSGIESTVENLKKRKMLDLHTYTSTSSPLSSSLCDGATTNEMVEILGMDNEVTLTRLPKRPRLGNNGSNNSSSSNNNDITPVVQRLGANPSISVRTLFPGEEEMNLHVNIEFQNVREVTPQGWEKCATMIQYDRETKLLWQQLQRPYGNQSSFLRHLILLEKYYRAGDLILAPNASRNAINYSTSVQNRLISYEGPEKMDEPIMEPLIAEYKLPRRLSGGYMLEKDRLSVPSTSSMSRLSSGGSTTSAAHSAKVNSPRMLKLNSGVSIIKKPPPNLQRLNLPLSSTGTASATATTNGGGSVKRQSLPASYGSNKVFQLSEPDMKRMQSLKRQKPTDRQSVPGTSNGSAGSRSPPNSSYRSQYQKAQVASGHSQQFQRHLRMQQEMLSRQSRGDFEPLICDMSRSATTANENSQNLIHNLNLPKSIQVTTKPSLSTSNPIPILPKIPKSLTVIPQTVTRPADK